MNVNRLHHTKLSNDKLFTLLHDFLHIFTYSSQKKTTHTHTHTCCKDISQLSFVQSVTYYRTCQGMEP